MTTDSTADVPALLAALDVYRPARQTLLAALGLRESNRDPLAEFSEHLAAGLLGATLVLSRVQAGHDLVLVDGDKSRLEPRNSRRIASHSASNAYLVMLYAPGAGGVTRPAAEPMLTMVPLRRAGMAGRTSWHIRTRPKTLVSN